MVGGHAVDGAVGQRFDQRLHVPLAPERRAHLRVGVERADRLFGHRQMVGRHLGRDPHAPSLPLADEPDRSGRREMSDVDVSARQLGQQDVTRHHHVLGRRRRAGDPELGGDDALVHGRALREVLVLGVADHRRAERQRVLHRPAIEIRIHDALAVVGERHAAGLGQLGELGQLLAAEPARHRADRVDAHAAFAARFVEDVVGDRAVVVDGLRVGHRAHGGEATGRGRARTGRDGLLVLVAGLAQVDVHVDESRTDDFARRVDDLPALGRRELRPDARDRAALDEDVGDRVDLVGGIDDTPVADQEAHAFSLPRSGCRPGGTARPSARPRPWRPGRGSPSTARRRPRARARRRGSPVRDA